MKSGLAILLIVFFAIPSFGSVDTLFVKQKRAFDIERIEVYKSNPDFNYTQKSEINTWWIDFVEWIASFMKDWVGDVEPTEFAFYITIVLKIIFWSVIIFALGMIGYAIYKKGVSGLINRGSELIDHEFSALEDKVLETDWLQLIDQALLDEKFNVAIRFHFLQLIQTLDQSGYISWDKSKSIRDYQRELGVDAREGFIGLSKYYHFAWFRDVDVLEGEYRKVKIEFEEYNKKLYVEKK